MSDIIAIGECELEMRRPLMTQPTSSYKTKLSEMAEVVAECEHNKLVFLEHGQILKCRDCGAEVTAVWAFIRFAEQHRQMMASWDFQKRSLDADIARGVTMRAAQKIESAWRTKKLTPCCPHCYKAILPDNNFGGNAVTSRGEKAQKALVLEHRETPT